MHSPQCLCTLSIHCCRSKLLKQVASYEGEEAGRFPELGDALNFFKVCAADNDALYRAVDTAVRSFSNCCFNKVYIC